MSERLLHVRRDRPPSGSTSKGWSSRLHLADVEALNRAAFAGEADVTKLSYHAYAYCAGDYVLLDAGSALGRNCGPLLDLEARHRAGRRSRRGELSIAIPGQYTTANFLLGLAFPDAQDKTPLVFSDIEGALLDGRFDAGLIIHENRFTYEAKGLKKIIDLGEFWEGETGAPIPLGAIVVRRSLPDEVKRAREPDRPTERRVRVRASRRPACRSCASTRRR